MDFTSVHNYNEALVFDAICKELTDIYDDCDEEFFLDVACYTLANFPARYIRHRIDMAFYLSPKDKENLLVEIDKAVHEAAEFIYNRRSAA